MDKLKQDRISIRINGKEQFMPSQHEVNEEVAATAEDLSSEINDEEFHRFASNNVINLEERRNERTSFKNHFFRATAFSKHSNPLLAKRKKRRLPLNPGMRKNNQALNKLLIALVSSVVIGTGFGYVVLSLFTTITDENESIGTNHNGQPTIETSLSATVEKGEETIEKKNNTNPIAGADRHEIAPMKIEVIQGGAFKTVAAANIFAHKLKESGKAAVIDTESEPILMLIGIGINQNDLAFISSEYSEKGQEVYLKTIETPSVDLKNMNHQVANFVMSGQALFQSLITLSTDTVNTNGLDKLSWSKVESEFVEWNQLKPAKEPASLQRFSDSITSSYQALSNYRSTSNEQQLWNSQQFLLEGLMAYQKWSKEAVGQ